MRIKRLIFILLCITTTSFLCACGDSKDNLNENNNTDNNKVTEVNIKQNIDNLL